MKKIALVAILAAFVAAMGIAAAVVPSNMGETEVTCVVAETFEIEVPEHVDLGILAPGESGDAYADAIIRSTIRWRLIVEDDTQPPTGHMQDSNGNQLQAEFWVDVSTSPGNGVWMPLPLPPGSQIWNGDPGTITVETSYHQEVRWGDIDGSYSIIVTWILEPDV